MAGDGSTLAKPEAWWGTILASARERATTAEVWSALRDYAASSGLSLPPDMFAQVNRLRSLAVGLRSGAESLAAASPGDALDVSMIAPTVYSRSATDMALAPLYHARFEMTSIVQGVQSSGWYTLEYSGALPATVGALMSDVQDYAGGLSDTYGATLVGIGAVEISAF